MKATKTERLIVLLLIGAFFALALSGAVKKNVIKDWPAGSPQFPVIRGIGTLQSKVGAVTASIPSGTEEGDLLLLFFSARNEANPTATDWTAHPACANQGNGTSCPVGSDCASAHILYNVWNTGDNTSISDVGNPNRSQVLGIVADSFDPSTPFDTCQTDVDTSASQSINITGPTTTVADTAVFVFTVSSQPDQNGTNGYDSWANGTLASIVEQADAKKNTGEGGSFAIVSATKEAAGVIGTTSGQHEQYSERVSVTFTVNSNP